MRALSIAGAAAAVLTTTLLVALSSIDQVPLLSDVLEAFGGVALTANRPSKHLSRRGSFEIALHDFTLRELLRVEAQSIQFS
jgi:hypothetical protein